MTMLIFGRAGLVRVVRPVSDFYVAGRLMPALFNGLAIAASFMAALVFVAAGGGVGPSWDGLGAVLLGGGLGLVAGGVLLAPYLREYGGYTLPDFLAERFDGDKIRPLAVLAVIACTFPALVVVLLAFGLLGAAVFSMPIAMGVGLGVAAIFVCILIGGMRSLSLSQIAQYVVLFVASLVAIVAALWQTGTLISVKLLVLDEVIPSVGLDFFAQEGRMSRSALVFCLAAGTAALPYLLMRSFTTPSAPEARLSFLLAPVFAGLLLLGTPAFAALYEAASVEAVGALPMIAEGVLTVAALAGLLAAGGALALSTGNVLSYDVYYKTIQPCASARRQLFVARMCVVVVTGLAGVAAVVFPQASLAGASTMFSLAASVFLPVLVLGVWWKRATADGALAGMIAGLLVCLYYMIGPHTIPFAFYESSSFLSNASDAQVAAYEALLHEYYMAPDDAGKAAVLAEWEKTVRPIANWFGVRGALAGVFAVPVGFLVMIGVSVFTRAPSENERRFVDGLRVRIASGA
jgi:cation/acetate symporter